MQSESYQHPEDRLEVPLFLGLVIQSKDPDVGQVESSFHSVRLSRLPARRYHPTERLVKYQGFHFRYFGEADRWVCCLSLLVETGVVVAVLAVAGRVQLALELLVRLGAFDLGTAVFFVLKYETVELEVAVPFA